MSEQPEWTDIENSAVLTPGPVSGTIRVEDVTWTAVSLSHNPYPSDALPRRRYWIAMWIGWVIGPLIMAFGPWNKLDFGVTRKGRFHWIEAKR